MNVTSPPSSVGRAQGPSPCGRGIEPHGGCFWMSVRTDGRKMGKDVETQQNPKGACTSFHKCTRVLELSEPPAGDRSFESVSNTA